MTSPFTQAGGMPQGQVVQAPPSSLQGYLALALQVMQHEQVLKQQRAEEAVKQIQPGTTFSQLTADQQKQLSRATGRNVKDFKPDEVIVPDTPETFMTRMGIGILSNPQAPGAPQVAPAGTPQAQQPPTAGQPATPAGAQQPSELLRDMATTFMANRASGQAHPIASPETFTTEAQTAGTQAQTKQSVAQSAQSAVNKLNSGVKPEDLSPSELAGYQSVMGFVPSQPVADNLSGVARAGVMKNAIAILSSPESSTLAPLLKPYGISVADAIGGVALGIGNMMDTSMQGQNILFSRNAAMQDDAEQATDRLAEDIGKRMGGLADVQFIKRVMRADPAALNTPKGQAIAQFMAGGYDAAMADAAAKGDPNAMTLARTLEILKVPQIASDEKALPQVLNLAHWQMAQFFTRLRLGTDRPTIPGDAQKAWDNYAQQMFDSFGGMFTKTGFGPFSSLSLPQQGPMGAVPTGASADSVAALQQLGNFMQGIGQGVQGGQPPFPVSPGPMVQPQQKKPGGLFGDIPGLQPRQ